MKNGFSPLTASQNGIFKHPSGLMFQWGNYPSTAMSHDAGANGYKATITFRESFTDSPQVLTDCVYKSGTTFTSTLDATANYVILYAQDTANGLYVRWCAIGAWK